MKELEVVIDAMSQLITQELASADPRRFYRIGKICTRAHDLMQMYVTEVGKVNLLTVEDDYDDGGGLHFRGGGDTGDLIRQIVPMMEKYFNHPPSPPFDSYNTPERKLEDLLHLRESLKLAEQDTGVIDAKIERALEQMKGGEESLCPAEAELPWIAGLKKDSCACGIVHATVADAERCPNWSMNRSKEPA